MTEPSPLWHRCAAERGLPPMPWGWFVVGLSHQLAPGDIRPVRYFDRDLVLYRTEGGEARVWDAHCPHLGAHLGYGGTVVGETVRCPFHHWRFDGDGQCVEVPGCERIPPTGKARPWPVVEHNGAILAWHHPDGLAPDHHVRVLPDEGWTGDLCVRWELRSHPQEIGENTVDIAHMKPVHETGCSRVLWGPDLDGPRMNIGLYFLAPGSIIGMEGDNDVELDVTMVGVGLIEVQTHVTNAGVDARYRICSTPIDRDRIHVYGIANMKRTGDDAFDQEVAGLFFEALTKDFVKDFDIWENKVYRPRPALSAADGPLGAYRRWARQFYLDEGAGDRPSAPRSSGPRSGATEPMSAARPARASEALHSVRGLLQQVRGVARDVREHGLAGGLASLAAQVRERGGGHRSDGESPDRGGASAAARTDGNGRPRGGGPAGGRGHAAATPSGPKIASVADYFATLEERFVPSATAGLQAVFQWELAGEDGGTYHAVVDDGQMTLVQGQHAEPTVTIAMEADDYVRVVNGELDGARAFTTGGGKVRGKIRMAMKMRSIFPLGHAPS